MPKQREPVAALRCPRPWTAADDRRFHAQLQALQEDIRIAGGLDAWLELRLDAWLAANPPCRPLPHRPVRRRAR